MTTINFKFMVRQKLKVPEQDSINLFVNEKFMLKSDATTMADIYATRADPDGFLYIVYTSENTYGQ